MKLSELIEQLEELQGAHGDVEVLAAYQPNYPLVGSVIGACTLDDDDEPVARIAIGSPPYDRNPYAPRDVFEGARR